MWNYIDQMNNLSLYLFIIFVAYTCCFKIENVFLIPYDDGWLIFYPIFDSHTSIFLSYKRLKRIIFKILRT